MMILALARNYLPSGSGERGGWNIADCAARSYDIEGMHVGTVAAGRIGSAVLRRLKPFDVHLHYTDRHRLAPEVERSWATFHEIRGGHGAALRRGDDQLPAAPRDGESVRRGDDREDEARRLSGEHGTREDRQPRRGRGCAGGAASSLAMRATSGSRSRRRATIRGGRCRIRDDAAYFRHVAIGASALCGVREILECFFDGRPIREEYLIVQGGHLAGAGAHSYSEGDTTEGRKKAQRSSFSCRRYPAR